MKIIKRIDYTKIYLSKKDNKPHPAVNYYIELDNSKWVSVRPAFYTDTYALDAVAIVIKNGTPNED